ncbi:MAG: hypothetical protein F4049_01800 [Gemmatimonadetes bacterium]|nr:hypothetical protein [Gemmatimonadota bacterium]MYK38933.1 hypothetical protein [Gemmatimonadota bacterium]
MATIAQMLRSPPIAQQYPELANPRIEKTADGTKQSRQLAGRASMLYTESGSAILSLGLNTASRGIKIGSQRPDAQVYDDIGAKDDTIDTVKKKIATITQTIIPTRSPDAWVFGRQNLIHKNSVFSKMVENHPDAEFLGSGTF